MANSFLSDSNCKALWRFETGALTVDSIGSNTLTAVGSPAATSTCKEGVAACDFERGDLDYFNIADASLDNGFPLKNGDTNKKISVCFWVKPESIAPESDWWVIFYKGEPTYYSIVISTYTTGGSGYFQLGIGNTNGGAWEYINHASALTIGRWYHVGITFENSTKAYRIRIWDDTAGTLLGGAETTGVSTNNISVGAGPLRVGLGQVSSAGYYDGIVDELVVFSDILTAAEIDQIRAGTYDPNPPAPPSTPDPFPAMQSVRRELSFPLMPHSEMNALKPLGPKLEDYLRQLEELLRTMMFGIDAPVYPEGESPVFTPGSVIFAGAYGGLAEDNANLFYDDANNFLGVGLNTPRDTIEVYKRIIFDPTLFNTLIGDSAGNDITTGASNAIMGYQAGYNYTSGNSNVAIGYQASYDLASSRIATGIGNVQIGYQAGYNDPGAYNVVIGYRAGLYLDSSGSDNGTNCVYIGYLAGEGEVGTKNSGDHCVGIGGISLDNQTSGNYNTCVGYSSGHGITTGGYNAYFGNDAGAGSLGSGNVGVGYQAASNADGDYSVGVGYQAFFGNGDGCTFVGSFAGADASNTGDYNTGIGSYTGFNLTTGHDNFYGGRYSGYRNETGSYNTAVGAESLGYVTANAQSNSDNTCLGYRSGTNITTGSDNIFIGFKSAYNQTDVSNLLMIDNQNRGAKPGCETALPLVLGVFAADSSTQSLRLNADVSIYGESTLGSESLNETAFTTHAKWDVTNGFTDSAGYANYAANASVSTLTQTSANMAVAGVASKWYKFTYTLSNKSYSPTATITTAFALSAVSLTMTEGTHTLYFESAAVPGDFVISVPGQEYGTFRLDDLTLKELQGGDLTVNGALSARSISGGGGLIPAGSDTQVQYNNGGIMGGDASFTWNDAAAKALTIGGCAVLGLNSAVFRPTTDSTTFFQILDADGGTPVFSVDSTNERVFIGTTTGGASLNIVGGANSQILLASNTTDVTNKYGYLNLRHYSNSEEYVLAFFAGSTSSSSYIWYGGGSGSANAATILQFFTGADITTLTGTERLRIDSFGNVNIGTVANAETLLELQSTASYLTLHNDTHEDTDGGRESRLNFKGEQAAAGAESTLARMEVSHDGTGVDEKGKIVFSTNDGADTNTPTLALTIDSSQNTNIPGASNLRFRDATIGIYSQADTFLDIFADGGLRIGDSSAGAPTNYTKFESDGTLVFNGTATVFNDANVGAMMLTLPAASQPDEVQFKDEAGADTGVYSWGFAIGEKVSGAIEIPHDYKDGTNLTFHVHWQGITAPAGGTDNVKWQLTYTVAHLTDTLNAVTTIVKEDAYTTQYAFARTDFAAITGTDFDIGDQFLFTLTRIAASADDYAGDAIVATVGFHYECDTVGSRAITTK